MNKARVRQMAELQRTPEWYAKRAGKLTASRFKDVMGTKAARAKYMREVVFERLAKQAKHAIGSKSLNWGQEVEPFSSEAFTITTGLVVEPSDFVVHPRYDFIGCSPDGLIDKDGGLEMKAPHDEAVHIETLLSGMPAEHKPQVQGSMLVTGRAFWYFVSYDPRQGERFRLYIERIERDDKYIADLAAALLQFNAEALAMQAELERKAA